MENEERPIKITREILAKNGFEDKEFFGLYEKDGVKIMCDCFHLSVEKDGGLLLDKLDCKYLHQMNCALKECGIGLEIRQ